MEKILVIEKGYTLSVTSWENDGDNYRTKSQTFKTKELAIAIANLCKTVFCSCNNGEDGIGNSGYDDKYDNIIIEYMKAHPELYNNEQTTLHTHSEDLLWIFLFQTNSL